MKKELFEEVLVSVKQDAAIMKGWKKPSRTIEFFAEVKGEVK